MPEIQNKNLVDQGRLKIQVTSSIGSVPIPDSSIEISYTGDPDSVLETVNTDENGQTPVIDLPAPDRKSTRLNSSHPLSSRMPSSA